VLLAWRISNRSELIIMTRTELKNEALERACASQALTNYPAIFEGFMAKGIAESEIQPRENVFTFHAWKALGRSVKRGEHGVRVVTFITCQGKAHVDAADPDAEPITYRRPHTTTVGKLRRRQRGGRQGQGSEALG
jgi:hypothetical protein